jgi:hypothetical protein
MRDAVRGRDPNELRFAHIARGPTKYRKLAAQ